MIYALHGFLGKPLDWSILDGFSYESIDCSHFYKDGFWEWARTFNQSISQDDSNILIGYSMGGRLAMHALIENSSLWKGAVIISAHPGLTSEQDKKHRLKHDTKWAKRFETDSWKVLMNDWNSQKVFVDDKNPIIRHESDYSRSVLSDLLKGYSLGNQDDLKPKIEKLDIPILWVAGEKDDRYVRLSKEMTFQHPLSKVWIAQNCSHRVPWHATAEFSSYLKQVCQEVGCPV